MLKELGPIWTRSVLRCGFFSPATRNPCFASPAGSIQGLLLRVGRVKRRIWKAKGVGLSLPLDQFDVSFLPDEEAPASGNSARSARGAKLEAFGIRPAVRLRRRLGGRRFRVEAQRWNGTPAWSWKRGREGNLPQKLRIFFLTHAENETSSRAIFCSGLTDTALGEYRR
jgi:hypothetical protein